MMRSKVLIVTATTTVLLSVAVVVPAIAAAATFTQIPELSTLLLPSISLLDMNFPLDLTTLPIVVYDIKMSPPFPPLDITGEVSEPETPIPVPLPEIEIDLDLGNPPPEEE
jgi:hypothetical protein